MKIRLYGAAAVALLAVPLLVAQTPYVVTTLPSSSNGVSSNPTRFTPVGDAVYFYAHGKLWKWSEAAGATSVKNIYEDPYYAPAPGPMLAFGNKLLFSAYVDSRGVELWMSDGTPAGTTLVRDIAGGSSSPLLGVTVGSSAFFTAYHPDFGRELWVTDGTEAGTLLVKDLTGDSGSSNPTGLVAAGGKVYFNARDQLWVSDGTAAGTIALASGVSSSAPGVLNGKVFFLGTDSTHGRELWSTDGTPGGTAMVKDINSGSASSWGGIATDFVQANGLLYFFAEDATNGRELWMSDGTAGGTQLVKDITPGVDSTDLGMLAASQSGTFFVVNRTTLWSSNGTNGGTIPLASYAGGIASMIAAVNGAYVVTNEPALYFSDGTTPAKITNVTPAIAPSLTANGATVLFSGTDGSLGHEPWISNGTNAGTRMLADIGSGGVPEPVWMHAADANVFIAHGTKLLRSNGTAQGTFEVGVLGFDTFSGYTAAKAALGGTFLYSGGDNNTTRGLWKSDGSVAGTSLVKEMVHIDQIVASSGGYALIVGSPTSSWNAELWRTDGTTAGTLKLLSQRTSHFVDIAGRTYFLASSGSYWDQWAELWRTDGTADSTRLVTKGNFSATGTAAGALYVSHHDASHGRELWRSDGTADSMTRVKDIKPGSGSSDPSQFVEAGSILFFTADDGVHGRELWRTDGTSGGTYMLKDIRPGTGSSWISRLTARGRSVYFVAEEATGTELWRSDGTTGGTIRLTSSGAATGVFDWLTPFDGKLVSSGYDVFRGHELWESDGTPAGTFVLADLVPGPNGSAPRKLALSRDLLFFVANAPQLWVLPRAATRLHIGHRRIVEGNSGSTLLQFTLTRTGDLTGASSVNYATENLSATAGADYQAASGTVSFNAGEATKQISIAILGDTTLEQNESFAVTLTGATGATISIDRALGVIEEDDRKVALSLAYVPKRGQYSARAFRITNSGPSGATVILNVSESPFEGTFDCDGKNPARCPVGFVPAGQSVEFTVNRNHSRALANAAVGRTITASISALELEDDLSDNGIARMIDANGFAAFPPYLIAGSTASAQATAATGSLPATVQLSLSGGVVVSPGSATVTQENPIATFNLTVGSSAWGWSTVTSGSSPIMRIPLVFAGETVRLDTSILPPSDTWSNWQFAHDAAIAIPITVAATLPNGTRPSGNVALRKKDGTLVQTLAVDAAGQTTFNLGTMPVGTYNYQVTYDGDESFHPLTVNLPTLRVSGRGTWTEAVIFDRPCGEAEITVTVSSGSGPTPTGSVKISSGGTEIATLPLVPTGTAGKAEAKTNYAFPSGYYAMQISATYIPDSPFEPSSDWAYHYYGSCPAPTVIASATSASSVSLVWSDVGANQYEVMRSEAPSRTLYSVLGTTTSTSFVDTTAAPGKAYLYIVQAKASATVVRSTSASDLATTFVFSDDPILFRVTRIKAAHMTELQQAANAVRELAGLSPATSTPPAPGARIQQADVAALRSAIGEALSVLGSSVSWFDGAGAGQVVKALHVQQMRNVMK